MKITYDEVIEALNTTSEDPKFIVVGDGLIILDREKAFEAILNSHEISRQMYDEYKDNYWYGSSSISMGVPDVTRLRNDIVHRHPDNIYVEIRFLETKVGDDFKVSLRDNHVFHSKLSCYPTVIIENLLNVASNISLLKGEKAVNGILHSIMMISCTIDGEEKYYDLVEDPTIPVS